MRFGLVGEAALGSLRHTELDDVCATVVRIAQVPLASVLINATAAYGRVQCNLSPRASISAAAVFASLGELTTLAAPASQLLGITISEISPAERVVLVVHRLPSAPPASPNAALAAVGAGAAAALSTTSDGIAPGALGAVLVTLAMIGIGGVCLCRWLRVRCRQRPKRTAGQRPVHIDARFTSCASHSANVSIELQRPASATPYQEAQAARAAASASLRRTTAAGGSRALIAQQVEVPTVADVPTTVHHPFGDPFPTAAPSDAMPLSEGAAAGSSDKRRLSKGANGDRGPAGVSAASIADFHLEKGQAIASGSGNQRASSSGSAENEEMLAPVSYHEFAEHVSISRI